MPNPKKSSKIPFLLAALIFLVLALIFFVLFIFYAYSGNYTDSSNNTVTYSGQTYKTVQIGEQTWMAENLNYEAKGSVCYENNPDNCVKYGRLYDWKTAMSLPSNCNSYGCSSQIQQPHRGICPSGWHIPSNADWNKLFHYVDGTSDMKKGPYKSPTAGRYLKATSGWNSGGNGNDQYEFSAPPIGRNWWSASEDGDDKAYPRIAGEGSIHHAYGPGVGHDHDTAYWNNGLKINPQSVRCVKDNNAGQSSSSSSNVISSSSVHECGGVEYAPATQYCSKGAIKNYRLVSYDGQTYKTVKIGTQTWMAENLNYDAEGSKCYENDPDNCVKYGRLYDWETAMKVCPDGWHLPSNAEWDKLFRFIDGGTGTEFSHSYDSQTAGKYLKAKSGWNDDGNGTDDYGFSALLGGNGYSDGSFYNVGHSSRWWSTYDGNSSAHYRYMDYDYEYAKWFNSDKSHLYSVRCVQD